MYPPRAGDLPKAELVKQAEEIIAEPRKFFPDFCKVVDNPAALISFKATCPYCGTRCMFEEPNNMFEFMTCHACHDSFEFVVGGFTVVITSKE